MTQAPEDRAALATRPQWAGLRVAVVDGFAQIWSMPEALGMEFKSAAYLGDWLGREGFAAHSSVSRTR
ncbi:MAG: hypothetical protein F4051_13575 [Boseongicola sp. SB0670_bin_30]|nr:hypothetical protein [Boseongicola sp. SB0670_bin_30]